MQNLSLLQGGKMKTIILLTIATGVTLGLDVYWLCIPLGLALLLRVEKYCRIKCNGE